MPRCPPPTSTATDTQAIYQRLTESLPGIVYRVHINEKNRMEFLNSRAEEITGYRAEELSGGVVCGLDTLIHPEDRQRVIDQVRAAVSSMRPFAIEYRIQHRHGGLRHLLERGVPVPGPDGQPRTIDGVIFDISDQRRAERDLAQRQALLQTIIDTEPECVKMLDAEGRLLMMNPAGLAMLEVDDLEQVKGQCVCPMIVNEHGPAFMDLTRRVFQGQTGTLVFEMVGLKGRRLWLETHAAPFRNAEGEIVALLAITRDITRQKRGEEALRQSEQMLRSIVDGVDEAFVVLDRDYRILSANKLYCQQVGQSEEEIIGRHCFAVSHGQLEPCHEVQEDCAIRRVFATGQPSTALHIHHDRQGLPRYVETRGFPLADAAGQITSAIEVIHDVTDRHLLELEQQKTQKLEAIGTLAGGIAHDFNNLLQGVFGYLSLAKMEIDHPQAALAALAQAEKALDLSTKLTRQLLTFAKGGSPVKKLLRLGPVIDTAAKFALSGSPCGATLHLADDLWPTEVDEGQIGQVVQNIVINAVQAMPEGGEIVIAARNLRLPRPGPLLDLPPGPYVLISIHDSGPGIPTSLLPRIFEPYFTTKATGSGLGLATSYSIVRNHAGLLEADSSAGGTTFSIYLPAAESLPPTTTKATPEPAAPLTAPTRRPARILVMDDEAPILDVASQMLQALGHEAETAAHGEEALAKFQAARASGQPFDLVILDLTIRGGMGGFETMQNLRALEPAVKAVVSTGYSDDTILAEYQRHGFATCLHKPYSLADLRMVLEQLLGATAS